MSRTAGQGAAPTPTSRWVRPPLGPRTLAILFVVANLILVGFPLARAMSGHGKGKDYPLWYAVGRAVLTGGDLYPTHRPRLRASSIRRSRRCCWRRSACFGRAFSILCIGLVNVASWWAAVRLSDRLAGVTGRKAWWVVALPSVLALPFIWDMYDLGQPNLMLLAIDAGRPGAAAGRREWSAGAMFARGGGAEGVSGRDPALSDLAAALAGGGVDGAGARRSSCCWSRRRSAASSATWPR